MDRRRVRAATAALLVAAGVILAADTSGPIPRPAGELVRPLAYSPGWLPPGLREYGRTTFNPDPVIPFERSWARSPTDDHSLRMSIRPATKTVDGPGCNSPFNTTIDGRPAYVSESDPPISMCWLAGHGTSITLDNGSLLDRRSLLRVARSIRPDPGWAAFPIQPPPTLRQWPSVYLANGYGSELTGTSPSNWQAVINPGDDRDMNDLWIRLARTTAAPDGGRRLRINDRPARYVEKAGPGRTELSQYVVVDAGDGWLLTVESWTIEATHRGRQRPPPTEADMIGLATGTRISLSRSDWIGQPD